MLSSLFLAFVPLALAGSQYQFPAVSFNSAAYFMENDPAGNHIVSMPINADGTLGSPYRTATGGNGSISINSTTNMPFQTDSLGSQGSVHIAGNMLFSVNAGSDTISMFTIDPKDPLHPMLVGSPTNTLGEFPLSVDYSRALGKVCVLNGGARAGVACFSVDPYVGLRSDGPLRQFSASLFNETTPPHGPPGSAAQLLFRPDSSAVFATLKGTGMGAESGVILAWPVVDGVVSTSRPIVSRVSGLSTPFGFAFISENRILVSDASSGGAVLEIEANLTVSSVGQAKVPTQVASCWCLYEPSLNAAYIIDASASEFYVLNPQTGNQTASLPIRLPNNTQVPNGVYDSAAYNGMMYSLVSTNGVLVYDLVKGQQAFYLDLTLFGNRTFYDGMAIWS